MIAREIDHGVVATAGPRYFGFVTGSGRAAVATDWLVSTWIRATACTPPARP